MLTQQVDGWLLMAVIDKGHSWSPCDSVGPEILRRGNNVGQQRINTQTSQGLAGSQESTLPTCSHPGVWPKTFKSCSNCEVH